MEATTQKKREKDRATRFACVHRANHCLQQATSTKSKEEWDSYRPHLHRHHYFSSLSTTSPTHSPESRHRNVCFWNLPSKEHEIPHLSGHLLWPDGHNKKQKQNINAVQLYTRSKGGFDTCENILLNMDAVTTSLKSYVSPDPKGPWNRSIKNTSLEKVGHRVVSHVDGGV